MRRNNNFLTNIWRNNWRFSFWRCKRTLLKIPLFSVVHFSIMSSLKFKSLIYSKICMCCSTSFQKCTLWHFHKKLSHSASLQNVSKYTNGYFKLWHWSTMYKQMSRLIYNIRFFFTRYFCPSLENSFFVSFIPYFCLLGFWYFGHFSCVILFSFFQSCPSCKAKCNRIYILFSYFRNFVTKSDQKPKMGWNSLYLT